MALHMVAFSLYPDSVLFADKPKDLPPNAPDPTLYMCEVARDLAREHVKYHKAEKVDAEIRKLIHKTAEVTAKAHQDGIEIDLASLSTDDKKH